MSAEQYCNYYLKYVDLDNVLYTSGKNSLNLFIDVKGCMQALYQEWAIKSILEQSMGNTIDGSIFYSLLKFVSFHKIYAESRSIDLSMCFFLESGKSDYHINVHKDYKCNRKNADFFGLDGVSKEFFFEVLNKNYDIFEKVVNKIPKCSVIRLKYMEADFLPWYITEHMDSHFNDCCHLIYSGDKDMHQCLMNPDVYQYIRRYKKDKSTGKYYTEKTILSKKTVLNFFFKNDGIESKKYVEFFPLFLSILGDASDGFDGIKGIGPVTILKNVVEIVELVGGSMEVVCNNIINNISIFKQDIRTNNKCLNKLLDNEDIIVRNLKLSSFQLLSHYVNNDIHDDVRNKKKQIQYLVNESHNQNITNWQVLYQGLKNLNMNNIEVTDYMIQTLFY